MSATERPGSGGSENLETFRAAIDAADAEIVRALGARARAALETRRFKSGVADPDREVRVVERVRALAVAEGLSPDFAESLWRAIMAESRRMQEAAGAGGPEGGPAG
ncbi:MAG: chorismate mutase [Spirochaetales bacterium]|nr:chorismate mutase [Spirochaetales bacterium]